MKYIGKMTETESPLSTCCTYRVSSILGASETSFCVKLKYDSDIFYI